MPRRPRLGEQLASFTPTDEAEAAHRRRMLELLDAPGDPFSRAHFVPGHFTASAFILSPDRRCLLLILHGKLHRWLQPGGHVDPEDTDLVVAARREALEETGVVVNAVHGTGNAERPLIPPVPSSAIPVTRSDVFDLDIHPIPANSKKNEPPHEHFDVRFLFTAGSTDFAAASDAKDARWVALEQITEELTDASVMRAIRKLS